MKTIGHIIAENAGYNQMERIKKVAKEVLDYLNKVEEEIESHENTLFEYLHHIESRIHTINVLLKEENVYVLDANVWVADSHEMYKAVGEFIEIPVADEFYGMSANTLRWRTDGEKLQADAVRLCDEDKGHYEFVTLLNNDRTVWRKPYVPV